MISTSKPLLDTFQAGRKGKSLPPFWFMRQAGRYLPEYKEIRSKTHDFLAMCYSPDKASEVTLQPIRRFGMDGAIIFSDILVIPHALGTEVRFEEKIGPILAPVQTEKSLDMLSFNLHMLAPVYQALRMTKASLPGETTLIGFAGSPWTLACYMVQGKSDKDFQLVRSLALKDRAFFSRLIALLTQSVITHVSHQIDAGAEIIQLFDSWSGVLSEQEFFEWVIEPTAIIVAAIKAEFPHIPVIGFPRQAGTKYRDYALQTKVDAVSIDASVSLVWARDQLQDVCIVQGNLDPVLLAEDIDATLAQAKNILSVLGDIPKRFIFNLGHGILQHTPVAHMQALCDLLKKRA